MTKDQDKSFAKKINELTSNKANPPRDTAEKNDKQSKADPKTRNPHTTVPHKNLALH